MLVSGCTNVTTIGPPPRMRGLTGLVVAGLWSTTTRFDEPPETPDEIAMREQRREAEARRDALRDRCLEHEVEELPSLTFDANGNSRETKPEPSAADRELERRCALIGF